jgi:hypothetical protein
MPAHGSEFSIFEPDPHPLSSEGERLPDAGLAKDYRRLSSSMDPRYSSRSTSGKIDTSSDVLADQPNFIPPELISQITQNVLRQLKEEGQLDTSLPPRT